MSDAARERAEQSISARFSRVMNATTSRWGMFTDPSIVGLATAPGIIALLAVIRLDQPPAVVTAVEVIAALPATAAVIIALSLLGARAKLVSWLAGLPFPLENMNAVLNGLGESLEVTFRDQPPAAKELNAELDRVSPECFVTKGGEEGSTEKVLEVRIGVVDSTRNPSVSNHQRFERVRALVGDVLVPLSAERPIVEVRVK